MQALEQAREKGDTIKDEIWRELARAKYTLWQLRSSQRREQQQALRQQLGRLMAAQLEAAQAQGPEAAQLLRQQQEGQLQQWEVLFAAAGQQDTKLEVPSAYTCPLTMEVYRDPAGGWQAAPHRRAAAQAALHRQQCRPRHAQPRAAAGGRRRSWRPRLTPRRCACPAVTPSGKSYERSALLEHLQKVGLLPPAPLPLLAAPCLRPARAAAQQPLLPACAAPPGGLGAECLRRPGGCFPGCFPGRPACFGR
jgi:hypothetical protein